MKSKFKNYRPHLAYLGLALLVLLPMLGPGYILTLDMVFTPRLPMPDSITNEYIFRALLHFINFLVPSQIIEKALLLFILVASGFGMFRLTQFIQHQTADETFGGYLGGALYMINPFTYSRFMAGQYSVLLGYALLPFFVRALLEFLKNPKQGSVVGVVVWTVIISMVSIHTIGLMLLFAAMAILLSGWRYRHNTPHLKNLARYGLAGIVAVVVASSYWLLPALFGSGKLSEMVSSFRAADGEAFATTGSTSFARLGNVLQLQGFWVEVRELFILPQDKLASWALVVLVLWTVVIVGGISWWRRRQRFDLLFFGLSMLAAIVICIGWIRIPGYREPQKFVGIVALVYAVLASRGAETIIKRTGRRWGELGAGAMAGMLVFMPVALTPTMFWGFNGQLRPRQYPADWFAIKQLVDQDASPGKVLFLPWHMYMHFEFARRILANPADNFFDKPLVSSSDPEYRGVSSGRSDPLKRELGHHILPNARGRTDLGQRLAARHIKYVLFAKEPDQGDYSYLTRQKDLRLISDGASLKLYLNQAYQEGGDGR